MLDEAIGSGKAWGRDNVVNVVSLQEPGELVRCKWRATVYIDEAG